MYILVKRWADSSIRWLGSLKPQLGWSHEQELTPARPPDTQLLPANAAVLLPSLRQQLAEAVPHPRQVLYYYTDVSVSWHGLVMKGLELSRSSLPYPEAWQEFSGTYLLRQWLNATPLSAEITPPIALVYDFWSVNNYYHWLVDVLPRLLMLRANCSRVTLLLPANARAYMRLSAQALGFNRFTEIPKESIVRGLDIVMPGHAASMGRQDATLLHQVRQELLQVFASPAVLTPVRRLFLSRRTQQVRRLLNEDVMLPLLAAHGIESVVLDALTLPEQVTLLQGAELIVGVHGAGLTNMLFLPPGAAVVELLDGNRLNQCYYNLATNLALPYYLVPCQAKVVASVHENNYDLWADGTVLNAALTAALNYNP